MRGPQYVRALAVGLFLFSTAAVSETSMVAMRDGVKLATDVHIPLSGGPAFPVVLVRTVYGRNDTSMKQGMNAAGVALVLQDTRGHGDSEGEKSYFTTDGWGPLQDGVDTINWLKAQPWCDGKIGTWGSSALGMTSALLAPATSDLAAQLIHVAPCSFYETYLPGGVPQRALSEAFAIVMGYQKEAAARRNHPTYDDYWRLLDPKSRAADITSPGFFVGGWFDLYPDGIIDGFTSRQYGGGPGARGNQMLVIGPWPHGGEQQVGDFTFPDSSRYPWQSLARRFMAHWLLGDDNGIMDEPPVHYYVLGDLVDSGAPGNEWRTADAWPPFATQETAFFLGADGSLRNDWDPAKDGSLSYDFDPLDPCPTLGGPNLVISGGPRDQRPVSSRRDVLKFVTTPLAEPLEVTGEVAARLFVTTDAPDTDFTAKLIDVYPDGREINVAEGIHRLKFRDGFDHARPLPPGSVGELRIKCGATSVIFNKGHRIGVLISSSNYPRCEVNPNTGADRPVYRARPSTDERPAPTLTSQIGINLPPGVPPDAIADQVLDPASVRIARNSVIMDAAHPSAILLPLRR